MIMQRLLPTVLLVAATLFAGVANAHEFRLGDIQIKHPWSRATPKGATIGAGYMVLINHGNTADRLVSITSPVSPNVEMHTMAVKDGVMTMRPVDSGIEIAAGKTVTLAPGGLHLMFKHLSAPLNKGDKFNATLVFEKAGKVEVYFVVDAMGAKPHHHGM